MKSVLIYTLCLILLNTVKTMLVSDSKAQINEFLKSGAMKGYHTHDEFWAWFDGLHEDEANRPFLSSKQEYGRTYKNRKANCYFITDNIEELDQMLQDKNIILITGLHHAREPLTVTMVMLITIKVLQGMRDQNHNQVKELLRDNVIAFIPMVNPDSYIFINEKYLSGEDDEDVMMIRKNRHIDPSCDIYTGGVDINRNYGFMWGIDNHGSSDSPCEEDYRGEYAFSEPETNSIKNFVEKNKNIVSGINIHSYGNLWIYPFSYIEDKKDKELKQKRPLFYDFYNEFVDEMKSKGKNFKAFYGNAVLALDYTSNGEAGDWLTGAKNILNFDVELGSLDKQSDKFYPPQRIIDKIVNYNWIVMDQFLNRHIISLSLKRIVRIRDKPFLKFYIFNNSISSLMSFEGSVSLIFTENYQAGTALLKYGFKDAIKGNDNILNMTGNEMAGTLKGRHILVLRIEFAKQEDLNNFSGLSLEIRRNEKDYLGYPHQIYIFQKKKRGWV